MDLRKTRWLIAALLCLAFSPEAAHGQSPELTDAYNRLLKLHAQSRFQEAREGFVTARPLREGCSYNPHARP